MILLACIIPWPHSRTEHCTKLGPKMVNNVVSTGATGVQFSHPRPFSLSKAMLRELTDAELVHGPPW